MHQPLAIGQGVTKKKFRYRRPRHTLKGRQFASEVDRIGLRLQLREQQAKAGDIVLLYGDESEALTHPYLARAWAKSGADLRVPAPGQAKKVAMLGSLNHVTHELIVHTSPTKRSSDFVAHLEQIDALYGPMPGRVSKPVVLVEDNGPIHVSKMSRAALAARAHWLTVEWLPKYTPELNDIEVVWHDLKAYNLAHQTFTGVADLDGAIHKAVDDLNRERMRSEILSRGYLARLKTSGPRFFRNISRENFDNWAEHEQLFPDGRATGEMKYPRAQSARQVSMAIRRHLALRAAAIGELTQAA